MCDSKNLNWCGRITLLLSICGILCIMMFQIWSYYFSLVTQMDELVLESPQVQGLLDICGQSVRRAWNVENCVFETSRGTCELTGIFDDLYVDYVGTGPVPTVNTSHIILTAETCGQVFLWILPW